MKFFISVMLVSCTAFAADKPNNRPKIGTTVRRSIEDYTGGRHIPRVIVGTTAKHSGYHTDGNIKSMYCDLLVAPSATAAPSDFKPAPEIDSVIGGNTFQDSPDHRYTIHAIYPAFSTHGPNASLEKVQILERESGKIIHELKYATSTTNQVRASWSMAAQGKVTLVETNNSQRLTTVRVVDLHTGMVVKEFTRDGFNHVEIDPTMQWIVTYDQDGVLADLARLEDRESTIPVPADGSISFVSWNPDPSKKLLVVGTYRDNVEEYPDGFFAASGYRRHNKLSITVWSLEEHDGKQVLEKKVVADVAPFILPGKKALERSEFGWSLDGKKLHLGSAAVQTSAFTE